MNIFEYRDYNKYLLAAIGDLRMRSGRRSAMAKAMGCQLTYFLQVLKGRSHLSLEQAERLSRFLAHSEEELVYFLLLVQRARAATRELQSVFDRRIDGTRRQRTDIKSRLGGGDSLRTDVEPTYYSSWINAAVHMSLGIPNLQSRDALAAHFRVPPRRIARVLDFLVSVGLARRQGQNYLATAKVLHLGKDSLQISRHHTHWRHQAIESLEREGADDMHYSGVFGLSREDARVIHERLIQMLKEHVELAKASKSEEVVYGYCADFFSLER